MSSAALQIVPKTGSEAPAKGRPVRFRGRSFMALVLSPEPPLEEWLAELDAMAERSPGFFSGRATVLDVSALKLSPRGLAALLAEMDKRGVRLIGIEGCNPQFLDGPNARLGMPIDGGRAAGDVTAPEVSAPGASAPAATSLVIDQPVRSGQSIVFLNGDVTVCGSVASGAEVVASGSIHVYGALRGRAIAGTSGNAKARIFCRKLDAELLAIDGLYMTTDALDRKLRGKPACAWLDGDAMRVAALD